jgi:SAM-dependent methyltransferase/uncharacterized protein YbaR (Trm112 family)
VSGSAFAQFFDILGCPVCSGELLPGDASLSCSNCDHQFVVDSGIPLLFATDEGGTNRVTDIVKAFYEENPFPNYDDLDSKQSLMEKARRGLFARLLDEQIPAGALVLEAGCGTGQLSNFLGMHWNRRVIGADVCLNSLRLGKAFRDENNIKNAHFLQMNLFRPPFRHGVFDLVISNGVLHHTSDPRRGFASISRLVKPGGYILIGLYNKIGRLTTDLKRTLFRISGDRFRKVDAHMRNPNYNEARKRAWFMDQYKHPRESKHTYGEALEWLESNGFEFVFSIPKIDASTFSEDERMFEIHSKGTKLSRALTQLAMLLSGGVDGALFIIIGRKLGQDSSGDRGGVEASDCRPFSTPVAAEKLLQ